jgi:hypothetical protein
VSLPGKSPPSHDFAKIGRLDEKNGVAADRVHPMENTLTEQQNRSIAARLPYNDDRQIVQNG